MQMASARDLKPATLAVVAAFKADDAKKAVEVIQGLRKKADLEEVGVATGFRMYHGETAGSFRLRISTVAPELTWSAREKAAKERDLLDRLMDRAREYDRSFDHAERARANGAEENGTAFIGFYRPAGGDGFQEMRIPELLRKLAQDIRDLRQAMGSDEDFLRMQERARQARPRIFEEADKPV